MRGLVAIVLATFAARAASQLILPPPIQSGPAWTALPKKVASIEDTCRMKDMEPTRRQCMRPSCFKVMPKANKRFCCCAAKAAGWTFKSMDKCKASTECPSQLPSHLVRTAPTMRDQLTYQSKLSGCAGHCVHECATQQVAGSLAAGPGTNDTAVLLEVGSACEDKCIEHCLETAVPMLLTGLLEVGASFTGRTASPVAREAAADFAEIQRHLNNQHAKQLAKQAAEEVVPATDAATDAGPPAKTHRLTAPTYANQARFAGARAGAKSAAAAQAKEGKGADWWQQPPMWWLPAPPEIGGPPPAVFNNLHSPYAAANTFGTYGVGPVQNAQPFFSSTPAPY